MNKPLIFLCISCAFLCFSLVSIFTAPIINKKSSVFEKWGKLNCRLYCDQEKGTTHIEEIQKLQKLKNICNRQKAMYNLEYASLIIDIVLGLIATHLSLFVYFKIGGKIEKITGVFGIIIGIICFILTLVYISYSTYIFNNDKAYGVLNSNDYDLTNGERKQFPYGAYAKWDSSGNMITPYEGEIDDDVKYIKYKDLGQKTYNYNRRYYEIMIKENHKCEEQTEGTRPQYQEDDGSGTINRNCDYTYSPPKKTVVNKYLYDNWITNIVFTFLVVVFALMLIIFGALLFKEQKYSDSLLPLPNSENIQIEKKD